MGYNPEHYQANKEKYNAKSKAWRDFNIEWSKEYRRQYYLNNKENSLAYSTAYSRKRKYNITESQYQELLVKQNGVCAICNQLCTRALAVDHCHRTNKVRGLLCNNCNRGIGHLKDNPKYLKTAIAYLEGTIDE